MSHPTSDEIQLVRYKLGKLGTGTSSRFTDHMITMFWREVQADVIADTGIGSYDSGNALQYGCISDGAAVTCLGCVVGETFDRKNVRLGDFQIEEQGLNWNVGIFQAGRDYYDSRYKRRLELLSTNKYAFINERGDYSTEIYSALHTLGDDARIQSS